MRTLDAGRKYAVDHLTTVNTTNNLAAELFQGNITPSQNDTNATYNSSLANYTGYAPVILTVPSAATTVGIQAQTTWASCLFQVSAPASVANQIYGYLIRDGITANVLWAERFAGAPLSMTNVGDNIVLIPLYSEQSQFP
jgi:hypothetical protein